jgi:hypothetical protein
MPPPPKLDDVRRAKYFWRVHVTITIRTLVTLVTRVNREMVTLITKVAITVRSSPCRSILFLYDFKQHFSKNTQHQFSRTSVV